MKIFLLLIVKVLLRSHTCAEDAVFGRIIPSRLQLFECESVSFTCEDFDDSAKFRVLRKTSSKVSTCASNWGMTKDSSCIIKHAYQEDSGEYWCEAQDQRSSNTVSISVTENTICSAGSVILESPTPPVMEGDDVTLHCRSKRKSSNFIADFYKDDLIGSSSTGEMMIHNISKSDEGLYKCRISGAGESAKRYLAVSERHKDSDVRSDQVNVLLFFLIKIVTISLPATLLVFVLRRAFGKQASKHDDTLTSTE
ncbi:Fc receptor-like protein 5 [Genypterus blacodes]|uniref:Fc receptor-like protein 5 n=1 Tax=Genypterus blacodes TaxID=154954 RepID=UPI003F777D62